MSTTGVAVIALDRRAERSRSFRLHRKRPLLHCGKWCLTSVNTQQIDLEEIVVLSPRSQRSSHFSDGASLGNVSLRWKGSGPNVLKIDSIPAFKGLESSVVILVELDRIYQGEPDAMIHVALTRAQHHVIVIGDLPTPSERPF